MVSRCRTRACGVWCCPNLGDIRASTPCGRPSQCEEPKFRRSVLKAKCVVRLPAELEDSSRQSMQLPLTRLVQHSSRMASTRSFSLLCLFMMTARILGFVLHSSRLASRAASKFHLQRCTRARTWPRYVATRSATRLRMMSDDFSGDSFGAKAMKERTDAELQEMVSSHNILAFIKGNRLMPQCGYSGTVVNILQSLSVPFETVDVMADDRIRQGIKDFSDWPTIPQLYLGGEFIGGADIVIELFQSGELQEMIEVAAAS